MARIVTSVRQALGRLAGVLPYIDGSPVDAETTVTPEYAESLLRQEVGRAEKAVEKLVTAELTDNMFAALCSWTYNLGTGALQRSSLRTVVP